MNTWSATLLDDVHHRVAVVARRGDVEEHELVGALGVVARRELDRIARVADADEVARPSRRGRRRRRGTGSRGRRARGDPLLDGEPVLVDRAADDRAREARARRPRTRPSARRSSSGRRRRRSRSPAPSTAARRAPSWSMAGPASMPSRLMSVTTSAPTPGSVEPLARGRRGRARSRRSSRGSRRRGRAASSPTATCPGCSVRELVDDLGVLDRRAADHDAVRRRPRTVRSRRRRVRTPPPVCTRALDVGADRLDRRDRFGLPPSRAASRSTTWIQRAPAASNARATATGIVVVDASRAS